MSCAYTNIYIAIVKENNRMESSPARILRTNYCQPIVWTCRCCSTTLANGLCTLRVIGINCCSCQCSLRSTCSISSIECQSIYSSYWSSIVTCCLYSLRKGKYLSLPHALVTAMLSWWAKHQCLCICVCEVHIGWGIISIVRKLLKPLQTLVVSHFWVSCWDGFDECQRC